MAVLHTTATTPITTEPATAGATPTVEAVPAPALRSSPDRRWVWAGLALLVALLAAVVTTVAVRPAEEPAVEPVTAPAVGSQEFLNRLANAGYIPAETIDQQRLLLERLVGQGHIPAAALGLAGRTDPLYTPEEQALLDAAGSGQVPAETIDTEAMRLKRLANEGMIPRAAAR